MAAELLRSRCRDWWWEGIRGVGGTKPGRGFDRLPTAAAVVIQRVLRGNLACSSSPAPSASERAKAVTWIASVTSRGRLATTVIHIQIFVVVRSGSDGSLYQAADLYCVGVVPRPLANP